uniref:EGF-like domain-containing protein n=1 Tax=Haemonchus contortus TaxID=6289 RepID=A0A7I4YHJ0_HAECO
MHFLCTLLFFFVVCIPPFNTQVDEVVDKSLIFDDDLVERFQSDFEQMEMRERKTILHKIGVLAVYFRIFKTLVPLAGDETGYLYRFPEPIPRLDHKLATTCESSLWDCISEMLSTIQLSHTWLYPTKKQGKRETQLNSATLKGVISDNLLSMEITATQILCFFTLRRITAFEYIPFCRFRLQDNTTSKAKKKSIPPMIWPGHLLQKNPTMIDEYLGAEYECAYESFCPDPCCHGVHSSSELFSSRQCALNKCMRRDRCSIEAQFNDDFAAMRKNRWNITCPCGRGLMYRADVETCVHADLCSDENRCPPTFECVNTITDPGFKCICQLGYIKDDQGKCRPTVMSTAHWHGFAFSEPHPKLSMGSTLSISLLVPTLLQLISYYP